jgi:hypothetical protein
MGGRGSAGSSGQVQQPQRKPPGGGKNTDYRNTRRAYATPGTDVPGPVREITQAERDALARKVGYVPRGRPRAK